MRAYIAVVKGRISTLFQYRAAAVAGMMTQLFWGLLNTMVLTAFYAQASTPQPITLEQAVSFIWLGQALLQMIPWSIDKEIEALVRSGNVAYELARPVDLYWMWYARSFAMRATPTVLRSIPIGCAALFLGLSLPASFFQAAAFCVSLVLAALLSSAMTALVIISLFWTISGEGILRLTPHITVLLTGMVVPLPLFPEWLQPFLSVQPFRGILDIPIRLYTGVIPSHEAPAYFAFQLAWTLFFIVAGRAAMKRAMRRLVIQGG